MANVVAAALSDAHRIGAEKEGWWIVRFITGDGQIGTVTHISADVYRVTDSGGSCYFDASKVLYMRPAEIS